MENFAERIMGILFKPEETWAEIKKEETSIPQLVKEYLAILAAVPAVAGFWGSIFKGSNFFTSLFWGILFYTFSLAGVWILTKVIGFLATNLNIVHDDILIFKLVAYSYTAFFIAGIFLIIPPFYWLSILGCYGFYLYYLGITHLLDCSKEEMFNFTVISIFAVVLILVIVFALSGLISGMDILYLNI